MFGGYQVHTDGPHTVFNGMYVFDTEAERWDHLECTGVSPDPRAACCMVYYNDFLWIFGGSQGKQIFFGDLFRFDIKKREWSCQETFGARDKPERLCCHSGVLVHNRLYLFGGLTAGNSYKDQHVINEMYSVDLDMFTWRKEIQSGSTPHARCCHVSYAIHDLIFVAGGGDLLSRTKYDQHVYVCNTAQGNKWTKLTSYFGNYMPKAVGMVCGYDSEHHRLFFFGGKNQENEMLSGVYELPLNKNADIMNELKHQELEEKKFSKLVKELQIKKQAKDDTMLQERDKLENRSYHVRTRSKSIPTISLRNVRIHEKQAQAKEESPMDPLQCTSTTTSQSPLVIPDMIRFDSTGTPTKFQPAPGGQATLSSAPVSPDLLDMSGLNKQMEQEKMRRRASSAHQTFPNFF